MRVLILSQYYDPEPVPKPSELAEGLRQRGDDVSVITGVPNYPSGNLYPDYRLRLVQRQTMNGIPVVRTFEYPYHGKRVLGRLLNYGSFVLSAPLGGLLQRRADVMYVWHPPLTVGIAAAAISWLRRVPFVYDVQDIWPESAVLSGLMREGFLVKVMYKLEKFIYRRAAHVLVVTEGARQNLIGKGVPPEKVSVMPHWIDDNLFAPGTESDRERLRNVHGWSDRFVVMFAGNLGTVQGLEAVVDAASRADPASRVLFVMVGDGSDRARLESIAARSGAGERIQFIGARPASEMSAYFAAADSLLVHLKPSALSTLIIPTKTLAYLAAGKPIVMAMEGAAADLVRDAGAGVLAQPGDAMSILAAINQLAAMSPADVRSMGEKGRQYARTHHSKEKIIDAFAELLRRVSS